MAVYAVGDVQGCFEALQALLRLVRFDPAHDRLWFTGDLVNRGPQSLDVLRFARALGDRVVCVLGNHDLHLLAIGYAGAPVRPRDTLEDVLQAPDREQLLGWLRARPLLHHDERLGYTLIHAGLLPQWTLAQARACAAEVETVLRGDAPGGFLSHLYGDLPDRWDESLRGADRQRVIVNAFTRLRYCDAQGHMALRHTGTPGTQPAHLLPWFEVSDRRSRGARLLFGHWSTLGLFRSPDVFGLDDGCVWGRALCGMRLDGPAEFFRVPCARQLAPGAA